MSFSEFIKDDACRTVDDMIDFAAVRMPNLTERVLRGPLGRTLESDDIVRNATLDRYMACVREAIERVARIDLPRSCPYSRRFSRIRKDHFTSRRDIARAAQEKHERYGLLHREIQIGKMLFTADFNGDLNLRAYRETGMSPDALKKEGSVLHLDPRRTEILQKIIACAAQNPWPDGQPPDLSLQMIAVQQTPSKISVWFRKFPEVYIGTALTNSAYDGKPPGLPRFCSVNAVKTNQPANPGELKTGLELWMYGNAISRYMGLGAVPETCERLLVSIMLDYANSPHESCENIYAMVLPQDPADIQILADFLSDSKKGCGEWWQQEAQVA